MPKKPATKGTRSGSAKDLPLKESRRIDSAKAVIGGAPPKQADRPNESISFNFTKIET